MKYNSLILLITTLFIPLTGFAEKLSFNIHFESIANIDVLADQANAPMRYSGSITTAQGNYFVTLGDGASAPDTYYHPSTGAFRFPINAELLYSFGFVRLGVGGTYSYENGRVEIPVKQLQGNFSNTWLPAGTIEGTLSLYQPCFNFIFDIFLQQAPAAQHHIVYTYSIGYNHLNYVVTSNDSPLQNAQDVSLDYISSIHRLEDRLYYPGGLMLTFGLWLEDVIEDTNEGASQRFYSDSINNYQLNNFRLGGSLAFGMYMGVGYEFSIL